MKSILRRVGQHDGLNYWLTNRIPRRWLTRQVGRISKCEHPWVAGVSIAIWKAFSDLEIEDAATQRFPSMHACFTRSLRAGARSIDLDRSVLISPCDGIVGASGRIDGTTLLQAKGQTYPLAELLGDGALAEQYRDGTFVTLRLTSGMYHRFHAPHDLEVLQLRYIPGDTWNVNPPTLRRIAKLFCQNERVIVQTRLKTSEHAQVTLVAVAAILVASVRLHFANTLFHSRHGGPHLVRCNAHISKGDEMGWFEHGSTIIVLAPTGFTLADWVIEGARVRMGQALLHGAAPLL